MSDFEYYRRAALALLEHHQLGWPSPSAYRVPGYPFLLATMLTISRSTTFLSLVNVVLSAALAPMVYALARFFTNTRAAVVAAVVCACHPTFVLFSPVLASEHLFVLLLFGSFLTLLAGGVKAASPRRLAATGVLFGAATLTRPDALFFAPSFIWLSTRLGTSLRERLRAAAVIVVCASLPICAWIGRNRVVVGPGTGLSTASGMTLYYAHNERGIGYHPLAGTALAGLDPLERNRRAQELARDYILRAGLRRLVADAAKASRALFFDLSSGSLHWSTQEPVGSPDVNRDAPLALLPALRRFDRFAYYGLFAAAAAGFVTGLGLTSSGRRFSVTFVLCTWAAYGVLFFGNARYRYATEVIFCIAAGALVAGIGGPAGLLSTGFSTEQSAHRGR